MHLTDEQIIDLALGDRGLKGLAHVIACAECRAEVEAYVRTLKTVRGSLAGNPPGKFVMFFVLARYLY